MLEIGMTVPPDFAMADCAASCTFRNFFRFPISTTFFGVSIGRRAVCPSEATRMLGSVNPGSEI
jgi:hypothetical protein